MDKKVKSILGGFVVAFMTVLLFSTTSKAVITEQVVVDPVSGAAIFGYDPVAYFTDQRVRKGNSNFETYWQGAYWHFANAANRDRFKEAPEVYAPRYNGYGAFAIAERRITEGNPYIWAIFEGQLYFFYSETARRRWVSDPPSFVSAGVKNWDRIRPRLER